MSIDMGTLKKNDPDTDDTIIEVRGSITVDDKRVKRFIDELEVLFEKYADDDSWFFKFS